MSVCRKLPDGTIQKIAGHTILLDANAQEVRSGTGHLTKRPNAQFMDADVTFSDPMPDTDYAVDISFVTAHGISALARVQQKTVTGFKLEGYVCNETDASAYGDNGWDFKYIAWKPIKLDGYTELQNKINNPDDTPTIDSMNLVTSDGVARAIENASAVWKGTKAEWEALPAADKMKYDLAALLDETLVKVVDREDGTETDVANLNKIFRGTQAEWDVLTDEEKNKYDIAHILDNMSSMYLNMPVGVVLPYMGVVAPVGWLFCDWSEFDPTEYPKLSAVLIEAGLDGTHTPDMREVTLVGIGKNTTDVKDSTEGGTQNHDEYTLGEFKDDQIQNITGKITVAANQSFTRNDAVSTSALYGAGSMPYTSGTSVSSGYAESLNFNASRSVRAGTVTRGKRKGVNYIICAK